MLIGSSRARDTMSVTMLSVNAYRTELYLHLPNHCSLATGRSSSALPWCLGLCSSNAAHKKGVSTDPDPPSRLWASQPGHKQSQSNSDNQDPQPIKTSTAFISTLSSHYHAQPSAKLPGKTFDALSASWSGHRDGTLVYLSLKNDRSVVPRDQFSHTLSFFQVF